MARLGSGVLIRPFLDKIKAVACGTNGLWDKEFWFVVIERRYWTPQAVSASQLTFSIETNCPHLPSGIVRCKNPRLVHVSSPRLVPGKVTEAETWTKYLKVDLRTKELSSALLGSEYELYMDCSKTVKD